jgi:hypothetical protein
MSKQAATQAPAARPAVAAIAEPETIPARRRLPEEMRALRMTYVKDLFQVVAFSVAGLWALASFWYQSFYVPRHEEPVVSYTLDLQKIGEREGVVMVRARFKMHNGGKGTEFLAGTYFNVVGRKLVAGKDPGPTGVPADAVRWDTPLGFHWGDPIFIASSGDTLLAPRRAFVGPGEDMVIEHVFPVRRDQVDVLAVQATALRTHKSERIEPGWVQRRNEPDGTYMMEASPTCRAVPDRCAISDSNVTTTFSLWDDAGAK